MHKKRFKIFFVLLTLLSCSLQAQNQASIWYFGDHLGLDFNDEKVTLLTDGQVVSENPVITVSEGTTSVADTLGNLLFYSNGINIWNRLHRKMPHGTGLAGDNSTTQTLAVPHPANADLYYIFTASPQGEHCTDTLSSFSYNQKVPGFWYSIIDMSADGGMGDVVVKNVRLAPSATEKMCATRHENGQDIWVMMHEWNSDAFRAYRLTRDSYRVDTNTLISRVGMIHTGGTLYHDQGKPRSSENNVVGQMKFSLDGTRLALAIYDTSRVEVFNFDKKTGKVTPFVTLSNSGRFYGIEFSPNGRFLYVSGSTDNGCNITQYDLEAKEIERSAYSLSEIGIGMHVGNLQLGPDHKIYYANFYQYFLPVIATPDSSGKACGYEPEGVYLQGGRCSVGLPNFPTFFLTYPEPVVDMPNVFTPNGDGKNELFTPIDLRFVTKANTVIYNRWGGLVYQTTDPLIRWTGNGFPTGVYYWQMEYEGKTKNKYVQKGVLSLLR